MCKRFWGLGGVPVRENGEEARAGGELVDSDGERGKRKFQQKAS